MFGGGGYCDCRPTAHAGARGPGRPRAPNISSPITVSPPGGATAAEVPLSTSSSRTSAAVWIRRWLADRREADIVFDVELKGALGPPGIQKDARIIFVFFFNF